MLQQTKNQTGLAGEAQLNLRMEAVRKEGAAERVWKDRILEIISVGYFSEYYSMSHCAVCSSSQVQLCLHANSGPFFVYVIQSEVTH